MKRGICIALLLSLFLGLGGCTIQKATDQTHQAVQEPDQPEEQPESTSQEQSEREPIPEGTIYINVYDGFRMPLTSGFFVDDSMPEIGTFFEGEDLVVEIYKQDLSEFSADVYRTYSNSFLGNTIDHQLDYEKQIVIGGRNYAVTAWHREKLAKVPDDKNYYMSCETQIGNANWTVLIKTSDSAQDPLAYSWLAGLEFFEPTANVPRWTTKATANVQKWNQETADFYNKYFGKNADLTWGIFEPNAADGIHTDLNEYEQILDYEFPIVCTYSGFGPKSMELLQTKLTASWEEGCVLEFTLQTEPISDGSNMMYDILQGEYDPIIETYAKTFKEFGHPILFRLMNEMNGDWCPYSSYNTSKDTMIYREVYRYIHEKFRQAGAQNIIWVWNPNEGSFPNFKWNHMLMYYPGDEYVDVIGLTAYNTGTYYASVGESWKDFATLYDGVYAEFCERFAQPMMITEFSCAKMGGDKRAWTMDMFQKIKSYDRIKAAIWWDWADFDKATGGISRDYRIDDVLDLFKEELKK